MSSEKKQADGFLDSSQSGMLSKINAHFFPNLDRPVLQEFIYLNGEITTENCGDVISTILKINQPTVDIDDEGIWIEQPKVDVINLLITSPGGDMAGAFSLVNIIKGSKIPVRTIALGEAVSAGFCLLMAGNQRVVTPYTSLMSHVFSTGVEGSYHQLKNAMNEVHRYNEKMISFYIDVTGLDGNLIKRKFLGKEDAYVSHSDAIKYNMVDLVCGLD